MFDRSPDALLTVVEDSHREESRLIARRLQAVADLLWTRTGQAEGVDGDPGYALVTGFARTSAEVAAAMNLTPAAASVMVGHAEALDTRLPCIFALLNDARIDWRTAELVIKRTALVDYTLIGGVDAALAERITGWQCWSRKRIINAVDAAVRKADPKAAKERRVHADTERNATVTPLPNGMAEIRVRLSAPAGAAFDKRLDEMADAVCAADPRTRKQRRADAVEALANGVGLRCECGSPDCPARPEDEEKPASRFVINVIATEETVDGDGEDPGFLEGYGVIDADQVRELAKDAALRLLSEPLVSDGQALSYHPSAAVERWVRCRDLTCCFPGCDRPAWRADIDHTIPFNHQRPAAGGLTEPAGLKCYCRQHHRLKTFLGGPAGWRDEQLADGTVVLTSPTGRVYRNTPAGGDLFPGLRATRLAPRKRNRRRDKQGRVAAARAALAAVRPLNVDQRTLNRARRQEIDDRRWRNRMRATLLVLKGGQPSTSPWCTWIDDPLEDESITADWKPPPIPPRQPDEEPPF
jgi:hypothetical protein